MSECDVSTAHVFKSLNNTALYQDWIKDWSYSDDIIDIGTDSVQVEDDGIDLAATQTSAIVEINFDFRTTLKLIFLRKSKVYVDKGRSFLITLETVESDMYGSYPKGIEIIITIRGEHISSNRTKLDTSFEVDHSSAFLENNYRDQLSESLADSLANIGLFCHERVLQNNLALFDMIRENNISKHQMIIAEEEEKKKAADLAARGGVPEEEVEGAGKDDFDRTKWWVDGRWFKWITERCEPDQLVAYNELKKRCAEKHNQPDVGESTILKFLAGYEFKIDEAEEKLIDHLNYMKDNNFDVIEDSRCQTLVDTKTFAVYKEDIHERPLVYIRIARLVPGDFELDAVRTYLFWNAYKTRSAFKPHIEEHVAIYDVKGLGKKNINMNMMKKAIPDLENNLPEICSKIYVVRPSFFLNMMWKVIKPFLHPMTVEKVQFLTEKQIGPEFLKFILPENLPVLYGGDDEEFEEIWGA
jgi:hypothetical protein